MGTSGNGKTFLGKYLLKCVAGAHGMSLLYNPTFYDNHDYETIFPDTCVQDDMSQVTLDTFRDLTQRQVEVVKIYDKVNSLLKPLFKRVATDNELAIYRKAVRAYERKLEKASSDSEREQVRDIFNVSISKFYKSTIIQHLGEIRYNNLSEDEKYAIRYIALNPHSLFVFDDCYTEFARLLKESISKKEMDLPNFYFRGRHKKITVWLFVQGYRLDPDVRKNAHMLIFTSKQVALGFYNLPENGGTLYERKRMEAIINYVFDEEKSGNKYCKLMVDVINNKIYYILAEPVNKSDIHLYSPSVRKYLDGIKSQSTDVTTKYTSRFRGYI
jgi:hypothetical protein